MAGVLGCGRCAWRFGRASGLGWRRGLPRYPGGTGPLIVSCIRCLSEYRESEMRPEVATSTAPPATAIPCTTTAGKMTDGNCVDTCCRSVICTEGDGGGATQLFPRILRNPTCPSGKVSPMAEGGRPVGPGTTRRRAGGAPGRPSSDALPCPAAVRTLGAPPRSAWPTEGLPCHSTGGGAPEGGAPRAGLVSCCQWQRRPSLSSPVPLSRATWLCGPTTRM